MSVLWSYLLAVLGVTGLLVASRHPHGWLINIGAQLLWLVYGAVTRQYGFLVTAAAYGWAYFRLLRKAIADAHAEKQAPARQGGAA